jgi:hypothetical protein
MTQIKKKSISMFFSVGLYLPSACAAARAAIA